MSESAVRRPGFRPGVFAKPSDVQSRWLKRGLAQPDGRLPLFDDNGQRVSNRTVDSCVGLGWAEPWFESPLKKNWTVCKLTHLGRVVAEE